ncbi:MAG TPA: hypothetical protein VFB73_13305 [Chloroflexota bacterium]|nr:hypothetical protein [Chloroflexota bacterium]HZU06937.1 hypothetical protein [Chloroflexota bacterium]
MEEAQVWELLARAGALVPAHYEADGRHRLRRFERFDPLADPVAAEQLGTALAERLSESAHDLVAIWDGVENIVLGYVVGRSLKRPVVRIFDDEGLVTASAPIPPGARAVFVAVVPDAQELRLVRALLAARDATLATVAVLIDLGQASERPIALARLESYAPEHCPACQRGEPLSLSRVSLAPGGQHG